MSASTAIRPPAVAGLFYPAAAETLRREVRGLLAVTRGSGRKPCALVVPHAGYRYSGMLAARGYRELADGGWHPARVLLLGPPHRVPVEGVAGVDCNAFATPLGDVHVDRQALEGLREAAPFVVSDRAHALEHSLEVQLPFLQEAIGDFSLLPLLVGDLPPDSVADLLEPLLNEDTVVVVSSDLSHFLPAADARRQDHRTLDRITALEPRLLPADACGCWALNALLVLARRRHWNATVLGYCHSGDTGGPEDRVVGYGAVAFHEPDRMD